MPAPIIVAHNDAGFLSEMEHALAGIGVATFAEPIEALEAIEADGRCRVLVSRIEFAPGRQTGVSLVRMVTIKRPKVKAILIGPEEHREAIDGVSYLVEPVRLPELIGEVMRLLS